MQTGALNDPLNNKKIKILYISAALIILFCVALYTYFDSQLLAYWSVNFWDVCLEGRPLDYYSYNRSLTDPALVEATLGPMTNIIPRAIWNFPLWLVRKSIGIQIQDNAYCLFWAKLQYVLFLFLFLKEVFKLAERVLADKWKAHICTYLTLSALFTLISVGYAGQNDIFWMYLSILATNCHARGKNKLFLFLSAYAISCKPFFSLAYAIIILLSEKRIGFIFLKAIAGISIALPQTFILRQAKDYALLKEKSGVGQMLDSIIHGTRIDLPIGSVSLFILSLAVILGIAYIKKAKNQEEEGRYLAILISAAYGSLLLFSDFEFYRPFILLPWFYIFIMQTQKEILGLSILLETALSSVLALILIGNTSPLFDPVAFHNSLIVKDVLAIPRKFDYSFEALPAFLQGSAIHSLSVSAMCILIALLVYLARKKKGDLKLPVEAQNAIMKLDIHALLFLRLLVLIGWLSFSLYICYYHP